MKKITLLFFMLFMSLCSFAQLATEGFEGTWPPTGWNIYNNGIGPAVVWQQSQLNNPTQPPYEGDYAAFLNKENVASGIPEDYLVTPSFNVPVNPELHFYSRLTIGGDDGSIYKVMLLEDGDDPAVIANYNLIQQWTETEISPNGLVYHEIVVDIPAAYVNTNVRLAFVMAADNGDRWLVDNVSVIQECIAPTTLGANGFALTSANLTWANPGGASNFEVEVVAAAANPTGVATHTATGSPFNVTGLEQDTDYKFYVRALCSDGGSSDWVGPFFFSTVALGATCEAPIEIAALPFSQTSNTSNFGDDYSGSPGSSGCGSTAGYLNGDDVVYSYTATADGNISINLSGNGTFTGMFVYTSCANIGVNCAGGGVSGGTNNPISIPTFAVTAGQTYYVVISTWASPQSTPYTLVIQQVNCAPPVGQVTTGIGQTSAQLNWTNPSGATSWEVVVQAPGSGIPSGAGTVATTNVNFPVNGLTPATPYIYYVRADCGNGTFSEWAGPYTFNTTICEPVDQCTYNFVMTDSFGDGWNGNTMTISQNGIAVATIGSTFTTGTGPITVPVQLCDGLPFTLFWNSGGAFAGEVGVSVVNSFSQTIYSKPNGTGVQNSLLFTGNVDCTTPACLPPTGLTVTNISTDQVDIGWSGAATGTWEYVVVPSGDPAPADTDPGVATTTNPTTVTGLTASTLYQFYVRIVCDGGTTSTWAGPFSFNTAVCALADQCTYSFVMTDSFGDGWNGNTMTIAQNGATVATIGSTFTTGTGPVTVDVQLCDGEPFTLFWNSGGAFAGEVGVSVVNNFSQTLFTKPNGTGSQNTLLYTGNVDCDNPACLPPTDLTATNITTTTADLGWAGPATGNWEYYVVPTGDPAPTDTTVGTAATTNPVTATGLTAATNYQYYVRVICDATNNSTWAGPFAFNTTVCEPTEQCNYVFELTDSFGDGWNGNTMTISQGGVPVATIGSTFTTGTGPVTVNVPLCPDEEFTIFWNSGGFFAGEVGLTVYTPFAEDVFTKPSGTGSQNTLLYTGTANCTPPACPKPQNVAVTNIGLDSADISWTEMGSAATWEVWVLPIGSPEPTTPGTSTTDNPYTAEDLEPGTPYVVYVRANCGDEDGYSNWAGPIQFVTALANDNCDGAIDVPVNPDAECIDFVSGTITGSTGSGVTQSCVTWTTINFDVWYSFVAEAETHSVSISNVTGGVFLQSIIFEGDDCGNLTQLECGGTSETVSGLTIGNTYYIMVYTTFFNNPSNLTSFDICIKTPVPPISVDATQYTMEELVQDVLIGSDCALVSNVTSSQGSDFGGATSIGYFNQNGSTFPFEDGVVMATGGISEAPGPYPGDATFDSFLWPGDADLSAIIAANGQTGALNNASVLEFDFVPFTDEISFDFLFASNEYGTFQCFFSDAFAFILTGPDTAVDGDNLAVIPGTTIPVSVVNIRNSAYNSGCASANEEYFDQYNPDNPEASPIGYGGQTIVMQASAAVTAGETYHIKLVIADYSDSAVNSAVFLGGGTFDIGEPDLGGDFTVSDGSAVCAGEELTLNTDMDPDVYDFQWSLDDVEIDGATDPSLTISVPGVYSVEVSFENTSCSVTASKVVEFYPAVEDITGEPEDLYACDASGFAEFDLTENDANVMNGVDDPSIFVISYFETEEDAHNDVNPIGPLYTNTTQSQQTVYVRIYNTITECHGVKEFDLIIQDLTPEFELPAEMSICEGTSGTISLTAVNYDPASPEVSYTWTHDGNPLADTGDSITVTEAGVYTVVIDNTGCSATGSVTVTVTPIPVPDAPTDVFVCNDYVLPALAVGNYFSEPNGGGTAYFENDVINSSMTMYVFAESGTEPNCTAENSFSINIVPSPVVTAQDDVAICDAYVLPALAEGNYYTGPGATGTMLNAGETITSTQIIYVYVTAASEPFCAGEDSFEVTIIDSPTAQVMADVTECDSYTLPALTAGNSYYTGPDGTGDMLSENDVITTTQMIYIYAETATTPSCTDQSSFTVTINYSPEFSLGGPYIACLATNLTVDVAAVNFDASTASYSWTVNGNPVAENGSSIDGTEFGTYEVTVTTAEGCTATQSVVLSEDFTNIAVMYEEGCVDGSYLVTAMDMEGSFNPDTSTYAWTGPEGFSMTGQTIAAPAAGVYTLTVTTNEGCTGVIEITVLDTSCAVPRGISPNGDGMNDNFDLTSLGVKKISIFNRYGREVYSYGVYTNEWHGQTNGGDELPTGTYFYSVERSNGESKTGWVYINREQ